MRVGDLDRGHRYRRVMYVSGEVAISGTLEYFQTLRIGERFKQVLTISGWVSHPLELDDEIEVHCLEPSEVQSTSHGNG